MKICRKSTKMLLCRGIVDEYVASDLTYVNQLTD